MSNLPVLISSAGRRVALLRIWRAALAELGLSGPVYATDASPLSAAFQDADRGFRVPPIRSPEFVPAMLAICEQNGVRVVVPTLDPELEVYAAHRDAFEAIGTRVLISTPGVAELSTDKAATHRFLVGAGLPTVRQTDPEGALADPAAWPFPLLVKPRRGSSSIGVGRVHSTEALEAAARVPDTLVQTIAPGEEYTVSFLADRRGQPVCAIPRKRLETRAGEVSKGKTVRSAALQGLAFDLCRALPGAYGALNVQVFLEAATGALNIIELNARFGGGFPLAWEAGGRFPRWILEELLGLPSTAAADDWRDGVIMLRFDDAVFMDAERLA